MVTSPVPNSVQMRLSYKEYASAAINPGSEPDPTVDPAVAGGQELRRVGSTLSPVKSNFKSNEIRSDMQMIDFRHGARKITGDITGELSPKTWQDFFRAVVRGTWAAGVSKTDADFTTIAADNATSKLTVGASDWIANGFCVGDIIRMTNVAVANAGINFTILALDGAGNATVYPAPTDMAPDNAFTVAVVGRKVSAPVAPVKSKWAIEHYYQDADLAHLFTECRVSSVKVGMPANGTCTIAVGMMGRNMKVYETDASPFFTGPAAPLETTICASFGGVFLVNGAPIAVITQADLTIDIKASTVDAAFNTLSPEIFTGVLDANGTVTALFHDNTLVNHYLNEDEVTFIATLTTLDSPSADFVSIFMPRVKLTSANFANSGEQGIPVTLGFQALKKPTTAGFDASTVVIQDSLSA